MGQAGQTGGKTVRMSLLRCRVGGCISAGGSHNKAMYQGFKQAAAHAFVRLRVGRREPSAACLACLPQLPWLRRVPPVGRKIRQQGKRSLNTLAVLGCCSDLDNLRGLPRNDHASTPASTFCKVIVSI